MLNELYHLSEVLERERITLSDWHKYLKPLPNASEKKPCFRISIDQDGSITDIEAMEKENTSCLRKWEKSNGNSFPGFNIQPLYRISNEDNKKIIKRWREGKASIDLDLIKEWFSDEKTKNWDSNVFKRMNKCLREIPNELQELCANIPPQFISLKKLCERVLAWGDGCQDQLFQALDNYIWKFLEKNGYCQSLFSLLVHEGLSNKRPEDDRGSISVFLDVPDWDEYPVAHEKTIEYINSCLLNAASASTLETGKGQKDAFGRASNSHKDKLPGVKLPVIGEVKLRAMSSEIPCQNRYGTIDAESFLIGAESRKRVKSALEWLSSYDREGETWGRADKKELIFAYPTVLPRVPLKLAACLGARRSDDTEARFENYAKDVVDCLKGLAPSNKEIELRVFSLRKMDTARTKVVFHRNYSAQRLGEAAREWQQGCANTPVIRMRSWGMEKGKIILAEPETPFPLQIAECLNRVWGLDGTSKCEVKTIPKSAGIELLLDKSANLRQVPHLLNVALQNGKGLFLSLGNSLHSNDVIRIDGIKKHKQLMPAILGLLLWKLGIGKESYMSNPPYLIGRILKLADDFHAL